MSVEYIVVIVVFLWEDELKMYALHCTCPAETDRRKDRQTEHRGEEETDRRKLSFSEKGVTL